MAGPARKLGLVQGFARGLARPLKLGAGQVPPAEGGSAVPRAQPAASDAEFPGKAPEQSAMQRHSMLSPRGSSPSWKAEEIMLLHTSETPGCHGFHAS